MSNNKITIAQFFQKPYLLEKWEGWSIFQQKNARMWKIKHLKFRNLFLKKKESCPNFSKFMVGRGGQHNFSKALPSYPKPEFT